MHMEKESNTQKYKIDTINSYVIIGLQSAN